MVTCGHCKKPSQTYLHVAACRNGYAGNEAEYARQAANIYAMKMAAVVAEIKADLAELDDEDVEERTQSVVLELSWSDSRDIIDIVGALHVRGVAIKAHILSGLD